MTASLSAKAKGKKRAAPTEPLGSNARQTPSEAVNQPPSAKSKGKRKADSSIAREGDQDESSSSRGGSPDDDDAEDEQAASLAKLQALGADFMASFNMPSTSHAQSQSADNKKKRRKGRDPIEASAESGGEEVDAIDAIISGGSALQAKVKAQEKPKAKAKRPRVEPQTVVFDGSGTSTNTAQTATDRKDFMSSKTSRIVEGAPAAPERKGKKRKAGEEKEEAEDDLEKQNVSNDKLLSQLLSTTLFAPGQQKPPNANGKRALHSNDTLARIMELTTPEAKQRKQGGSGVVGRGFGELAFQRSQHGHGSAPTKMQYGLLKAQKEREKKDVEKQKELGIYDPRLRKGEARRGGGKDESKRERGIGMGVGKFKNGALHISKKDVARVNSKRR